MINDDFDVYVTPDIIVEVSRGAKTGTVAMYEVNCDGPKTIRADTDACLARVEQRAAWPALAAFVISSVQIARVLPPAGGARG